MGRHTAPGPNARNRLAALTAAAVVVGAGGTVLINERRSAESDTSTVAAASSAARAGSGAGCSDPTAVTVSTSPDMAPTLTTVADELERRGGSTCVDYQVRSVVAGTEAERLMAGGSGRPQVWVPDSPLWVDRVEATAKLGLRFGDEIASSPVGLAVPEPLAEAGAATGPRTWAQFLASTDRVAMSDPAYSTASMLALVSARRAATKPAEADLLQRTIVDLSRSPQDDRSLMSLAAFGSRSSAVFPASEQQMYAERSRSSSAPVSAVTLADGAPDFSYGVVAVPPAKGDQGAPEAAVTALREALRSQTGRDALVKAGFQVDGVEGPDVPGMVDVRSLPTSAATPSATEMTQALAAWNAVRRTMRMIVAIDVSGSMRQKAAPGMTRIQLAAGAAGKALAQLPDATQMGVWIFSTNRGPDNRPWVEASPVVTLGEKDENGTSARSRLQKLAATFPSLPAGDTGLYSTIAAAVERAQQGYDPDRVNSVVLMTDGVNDDPGGTMTKQALLEQLRKQASGPKPVRVVLVGMGDATDMTTLHEIAAASGGSAYNATEPDAIEKVIVGALTARMAQVAG